jgi:hypothetical protein
MQWSAHWVYCLKYHERKMPPSFLIFFYCHFCFFIHLFIHGGVKKRWENSSFKHELCWNRKGKQKFSLTQ